VLVATTEEVTLWQLHPHNFALNNVDADAVSEYPIEFILSLHDLKKSAAGLIRFVLRAYLGE
jgi:hypothetical protein